MQLQEGYKKAITMLVTTIFPQIYIIVARLITTVFITPTLGASL